MSSNFNPPYPKQAFPVVLGASTVGSVSSSGSTGTKSPAPPYPTVPYPGFTGYNQQINRSNDSFGQKLQQRIQPARLDSNNSVDTLRTYNRNDSIQSGSTYNSQFSNNNQGGTIQEDQSIEGLSNYLQNTSMEDISIPVNVRRFNRFKEDALNDFQSGKFTPEVQLSWVKIMFEYTTDESFIKSYNINGEKLNRELTPSEVKKNEHAFIKQAVKLLKKITSDTNYSEAQLILGSLYSQVPTIKVIRPNILEKNYEKSFSFYKKAASQSNPMALYRLGVSYELGIGTSVNTQLSLESFIKSANLGNVQSMFKLGMVYLRGGLNLDKDAQNATLWLLKASKLSSQENPHALFELGKLFERDLTFLTSPSNSNSTLTKSDLKFLHDLDQLGFHQNDQIALNYYKEAAKFQYPPAQCKLGWCYEYGKLGVDIDPKKSIGWYSRSAKNGYNVAEMALSGWYLTGAKNVLEPNDKEAFLWAMKSAESGFVKAEYAIGYFYEVGLGCDVDLELSRKFYLRAATQGHEKAIEKLKRR